MRGEEVQAHRDAAALARELQHRRGRPKTAGKRDARLVLLVRPVMPAVIAAGIGVDRRIDRPVLAGEFLRTGLAPSLQNDLERLQRHVVAGGSVNAEHDLVARGRAGAEAKIDPPTRHMVELRKLRGDGQRMVLVEHRDASAEHDAVCLADRTGDDLHRAGNPRIMRRQMRADPHFIETVPLRHTDDIDIPVDDLRYGPLRVAGWCEKHPELERHLVPLFPHIASLWRISLHGSNTPAVNRDAFYPSIEAQDKLTLASTRERP